MRITISGTPGSGKSTIAKLLVRELGYPYVNVGQIFRDAAEQRGMSLPEFARYVNRHPEVDRKLDRELTERARQRGALILEGRLAGWMLKRARIPAFRIWITAREPTRIERLMRRDGGSRAETARKLRERAAGETARYRRTYGIDLSNLAPYDLIIKTDERTPEETVTLVLAAVRAAQKT